MLMVQTVWQRVKLSSDSWVGSVLHYCLQAHLYTAIQQQWRFQLAEACRLTYTTSVLLPPFPNISLFRDSNKWLHTEQNEWIYTLEYVYIHPYVIVHLKCLKRLIFRNGRSIHVLSIKPAVLMYNPMYHADELQVIPSTWFNKLRKQMLTI